MTIEGMPAWIMVASLIGMPTSRAMVWPSSGTRLWSPAARAAR